MVDVYSDWSGPCSAMTNFLKKIKLEVNDDLLHYAMAKSGTKSSKLSNSINAFIYLYFFSNEYFSSSVGQLVYWEF